MNAPVFLLYLIYNNVNHPLRPVIDDARAEIYVAMALCEETFFVGISPTPIGIPTR